jgi:hypothetical protein
VTATVTATATVTGTPAMKAKSKRPFQSTADLRAGRISNALRGIPRNVSYETLRCLAQA